MKLERIQDHIIEEAEKRENNEITVKEFLKIRYGEKRKKEEKKLEEEDLTSEERKRIKSRWKSREERVCAAFNQLLIRNLVWKKVTGWWLEPEEERYKDIEDYLDMAEEWDEPHCPKGKRPEIVDLRENEYGVGHRDYGIYDRDLIVTGGSIHASLRPERIKVKENPEKSQRELTEFAGGER